MTGSASETPYRIEPYRPADRKTVEEICAQTGLRGRLDRTFCDRDLFVKFWLSPYLDGQPENCLVARDADGVICGYLVGTIGRGYPARVLRTTFPHLLTLLFRWASGRYRHHPPTGRFIRWLLTRSWRENPTPPADLPAHFHLNLRPDVRKGLGWELLRTFEGMIREKGFEGWYAVVFSSSGKRDVKLYRRLNFGIGDIRRCTLFSEETQFVTIYRRMDDGPLDPLKLGRWIDSGEGPKPDVDDRGRDSGA
ncbi:MAG: hypothetical protein SFU56_22380 [Capsulimonadales bacterium]|nr:hypothetical protein [Capsulimonadales bacterium]